MSTSGVPSPPEEGLLDYCTNEEQRKRILYWRKLGTAGKAAIALGISKTSLIKMVGAVRKRAEKDGFYLSKEEEPLAPDAKVVSSNVQEINRALAGPVASYVITWAQNATPVHTGFWQALDNYCRHTGALRVVIPGRYRNPTSIWSQQMEQNEYWCNEVAPFLMDRRVYLSDGLIIMGDIKMQPTKRHPLTGYDTITGGASGIFGHPNVALKTVATPQNLLPKILTSTGACTIPNYTDTDRGKLGEFSHTIGATVVDIEADGVFHIRQINAHDDGSFIDMNYSYSPVGVQRAARPLALVMGDVHTDFIDPVCEQITFHNPDSILNVLRPERVILHDWYDGYSGSHHHQKKPFTRFAKHHSGKHNVEAEIDRTIEKTMTWVRPGTEFFVVDSNHNGHLLRWLEESDPKKDPENAKFYHWLSHQVYLRVEMRPNGAYVPNPLQIVVEEKGIDNLRFLSPGEDLMVADIDCSHHGHLGANGSRGSLRQFNRIGVKTVTGHSHSPGIEGGAFACGTNCYLKMEYNQGPSSWLQSDTLIYANGKRTLIHKIEGRWCAKRTLRDEVVFDG